MIFIAEKAPSTVVVATGKIKESKFNQSVFHLPEVQSVKCIHTLPV
jgi:hypothetical protein